MKKLFVISVTALVGGAAICLALRYEPIKQCSPYLEENIEALAQSESGGTPYKCYTSLVYCAGASVVDCTTCELVENKTDALFNFHDWCYR